MRIRQSNFLKTAIAISIGVLASCLFAGCGDLSRDAGRVRGTVVLDGKPLTSGNVIARPSTGDRGAKGAIQPDGSFMLSTVEHGDSIVPGEHHLAVIAYQPNTTRDDSPEAARKLLVPTRYTDPSTSGLKVNVITGEEHSIELHLSTSEPQ